MNLRDRSLNNLYQTLTSSGRNQKILIQEMVLMFMLTGHATYQKIQLSQKFLLECSILMVLSQLKVKKVLQVLTIQRLGVLSLGLNSRFVEIVSVPHYF